MPAALESEPRCKLACVILAATSGSNSAVECQLPKLDVAGSIPVSRSIISIVCAALLKNCCPTVVQLASAKCMPGNVFWGNLGRNAMKHVFFDMDGTLVDPREGFVNCAQHALVSLGYSRVDPDYLATFVGPPLRQTFAALVPEADGRSIELLVKTYRERFRDRGASEITPYPGISEALRTLEGMDIRAYVMTVRAHVNARLVLDRLHLTDYFHTIYGPELDEPNPDKAVLIRRALEVQGIDPDDAVMVGDKSADIVAARANGMKAVAVSWGYGIRSDLIAAGPEHLVDSVPDLLKVLGAIASRQ